MCGDTPRRKVAKAVYTLNCLTVPEKSQNPTILNHFLFSQSSGDTQSPRPKVMVRNVITHNWEGPWDLITWGRGYACVSTDTGTQWIPARCVPPALHGAQDQRQYPHDDATADVERQWLQQPAHLPYQELKFLRWQIYLRTIPLLDRKVLYITKCEDLTWKFWDRLLFLSIVFFPTLLRVEMFPGFFTVKL